MWSCCCSCWEYGEIWSQGNKPFLFVFLAKRLLATSFGVFLFFFLEHTYEFKKADLSLFKEQRTRQAASNEKGRKKMYREKRRFAVERSRELPDTSFPHFSPFESKNKERGMTNKKKKVNEMSFLTV